MLTQGQLVILRSMIYIIINKYHAHEIIIINITKSIIFPKIKSKNFGSVDRKLLSYVFVHKNTIFSIFIHAIRKCLTTK